MHLFALGFLIGLPIAMILFLVGFGDAIAPVGEQTKEGFKKS